MFVCLFVRFAQIDEWCMPQKLAHPGDLVTNGFLCHLLDFLFNGGFCAVTLVGRDGGWIGIHTTKASLWVRWIEACVSSGLQLLPLKEHQLPCSPPVKLYLLNTFLYVQDRDDEQTHSLWVVLSGRGRSLPRQHEHEALLLFPGPGWCRWLKALPEPCWVSPRQVLKGYGTACTLGDPGLCTWRWRNTAPARWGWWRKTGGKDLKTETQQQGDLIAKCSHRQANDIQGRRSCLAEEHATW